MAKSLVSCFFDSRCSLSLYFSRSNVQRSANVCVNYEEKEQELVADKFEYNEGTMKHSAGMLDNRPFH